MILSIEYFVLFVIIYEQIDNIKIIQNQELIKIIFIIDNGYRTQIHIIESICFQ